MKLNCKNIIFTDSATKGLLINTFTSHKVSALRLNVIAVDKIKSLVIRNAIPHEMIFRAMDFIPTHVRYLVEMIFRFKF
jgi:hypothetical protein